MVKMKNVAHASNKKKQKKKKTNHRQRRKLRVPQANCWHANFACKVDVNTAPLGVYYTPLYTSPLRRSCSKAHSEICSSFQN